MTIDRWQLMAEEFDRLLKEASENGMPYHEFYERMTRLEWEFYENEKSLKPDQDEDQKN